MAFHSHATPAINYNGSQSTGMSATAQAASRTSVMSTAVGSKALRFASPGKKSPGVNRAGSNATTARYGSPLKGSPPFSKQSSRSPARRSPAYLSAFADTDDPQHRFTRVRQQKQSISRVASTSSTTAMSGNVLTEHQKEVNEQRNGIGSSYRTLF